ncbi:hypothetical protein NDN08_007804 [Rhodosorus marinus]|uniref:Uncharacterized protein n=1 Tax=Rhodosorus marinus TaxID=101924 RepID=A0AAV8V265_9RHOD|nr:hypothetical protein NDN08_007804 [Rhodosorus marinus]
MGGSERDKRYFFGLKEAGHGSIASGNSRHRPEDSNQGRDSGEERTRQVNEATDSFLCSALASWPGQANRLIRMRRVSEGGRF